MKFHFSKYKEFFPGWIFFIFSSLESSLLKDKRNMRLESSISENVGTFLIIELESFILGNIRNFFEVDYFYFFELGLYLKVVS